MSQIHGESESPKRRINYFPTFVEKEKFPFVLPKHERNRNWFCSDRFSAADAFPLRAECQLLLSKLIRRRAGTTEAVSS